MNWKKALIAATTKKKYQAFLNDTCNPEQAAEHLWAEEIVPLLQSAPYWQAKLDRPSSWRLEDFDITVYEDYHEGLLAAHHTKTQPFNGEEISFWSETSGTSGIRKFFPITPSFQKQFQRTMPPFIHSLTQRFSGFFKHKLMYLVAVDANKTTPAGTPSGWISNFNYKNLPALTKRFYAIPSEIFVNSETYNQWAPVYALAQDLCAIFAVTPMVIDAFYELCAARFSESLPFLLGTTPLPAELPPLKISRKRRKYLQKLADETKPSFKKLWPAVQFAGCWTSGLCEYPAQQLRKTMGTSVSLIDVTYSATEGWLTVPLENDVLGGVLHPGAHIVEFIEEGQDIHKENLLPSWELKVGKKYEVFLTTAMGFVRYRLKDIVKCTGYYNHAPWIEFCYKTQLLKLESCSITGQELQAMLQEVNLDMAPHWYFARNNQGNRIILVTDDSVKIEPEFLARMHECMMEISETYAHSVGTEEVIPMAWLALSMEELIRDHHAQTKPKLISQEVVEVM